MEQVNLGFIPTVLCVFKVAEKKTERFLISLRGDTFFSTIVVLVTISHILQLPSRVRAQLRVKPVTLF